MHSWWNKLVGLKQGHETITVRCRSLLQQATICKERLFWIKTLTRARKVSYTFLVIVFSENLKFGNASMKGDTWIGGPTDALKSQHVPGYSGFIPQVAAENLFGKMARVYLRVLQRQVRQPLILISSRETAYHLVTSTRPSKKLSIIKATLER